MHIFQCTFLSQFFWAHEQIFCTHAVRIASKANPIQTAASGAQNLEQFTGVFDIGVVSSRFSSFCKCLTWESVPRIGKWSDGHFVRWRHRRWRRKVTAFFPRPNPVFKVSQIILRKLCHSIISPCEPRVICWCVTLALNRGGAWLLQSLNWLELLQGSQHFAPWGQSMQVTWGRRGMQSYCALHLPWTLACANVANALKDKIFWQNMKWRTHEVSGKIITGDKLTIVFLTHLWICSEQWRCILKSGNRMDASFFVGVPNLYQTPKTFLLEPHMQFQVSELQLNVDTWNFCCTANLTYYSYDDEDIDTDLTQFLALGVDWNAFYIKIVHCSHLVLWHIVTNIT